MQTKSLILAACTLLLFQWSFSQAICGFDAIHQKKMKEDPVYRKNVLAGDAAILKYLRAHPVLKLAPSKITADKLGIPQQGVRPSILGTALYTIPVVVHVVHTGGPVGSIYNPTDARILEAINYLNAVYNGSYPGTQGVGDLQIQFVLAQRDPDCNPTNGINRVDGSGISGYVSDGVQWGQTTTGTADINVKNLTRWDPTQYYNIWLVDKINGNDGTSGSFIAGYAYFPGSASTEDGTVMLATQMQTGQKTLPHEIGHAFNLLHPFEGSADSTSCPINTDCTLDGDMVCDTDPISKHYSIAGGVNFTCRTGNSNPCVGGPYTISTESNYMNYSYCYTLFTAGQKARMLASAAGPYRSSLSSSLGGTAPGAGSSPCVPKINFELIGDQKTEATAATSGCRSYADYIYKMIIGASPSAAATATLSVNSGTALKGRDFDYTTNGSFTSPSSTLTFPAGSLASQPFTIRIYDDASVNLTRNFVLGFTVNNGGGNAMAGNGKPNFTMVINENDVAPASGTSTGIVSLGTVSSSYPQTPFDAKQVSQRVQFLYKASELTRAGVPAGSLSRISLYVSSKLSTRAFTNLNINLGKAGVNYLVDHGLVTLGSSMTLVKTLASYNTVAGWNDFSFDTPYAWDGKSNLVIEICYDNGTTTPADAGDVSSFYSDGGDSVQGNLFFQNGVNCSQSFTTLTYIANGTKPIIKFSYGIPGTAIETIVNSSQQQYLGPNTDLYFYDQVNNQLMARIQNPGAHDYGCTQVIVDRAGSATTAFWNNNTANHLLNKTFRVLPAANNPSGSYTITLYYTQAEIAAWQSATGQTLSNIQLIKVANRISDVTPATPTGGGSFVIAAPTIGSLGTNTSLTYNFTTGFSGFGAGVPGSAILPVGLLDFKGRLKNNNVVLDWSTSFESGSKEFEIQRSYDANTFTTIGSVAAAGNSSAARSYSFKDPAIAQDKNYYRLKQTDRDSKFIYSKIILIEDPHSTDNAFTVLTNPFTASLDIAFSRTVTGKVQVRLLDITGKEILRQSVDQTGLSRMRIDLSGKPLSSGIYLLEVWYNNERHVARVIKN